MPINKALVIATINALMEMRIPKSNAYQLTCNIVRDLLNAPANLDIISEKTFRNFNTKLRNLSKRLLEDSSLALSGDDISVPKKLCDAADVAIGLGASPEKLIDLITGESLSDLIDLFAFAAKEAYENKPWRFGVCLVARVDAFATRQREIMSNESHTKPLVNIFLKEGDYPFSIFWDFVLEKETDPDAKDLLSRDDFAKNIYRVRKGLNLNTAATLGKLNEFNQLKLGTLEAKHLRVSADITHLLTCMLLLSGDKTPPQGYVDLYLDHFEKARIELKDYQTQLISNFEIEQHKKKYKY